MEDSGAHLEYLKDLPMDKRINSLGTFLGRAKQAAHTNGEERVDSRAKLTWSQAQL